PIPIVAAAIVKRLFGSCYYDSTGSINGKFAVGISL
ncbi:unnamed protein product, partial [Rotaria sp. Silwood2]